MRKTIIAILFLMSSAYGKNRDPKDYPQQAKVISFSQRQEKTRLGCSTDSSGTDCDIRSKTYHILDVEIEGQRYTVSCWRCDPLIPGQVYPAKVQLKDMKVLIIHEKSKGQWGQDDYDITNMSSTAN